MDYFASLQFVTHVFAWVLSTEDSFLVCAYLAAIHTIDFIFSSIFMLEFQVSINCAAPISYEFRIRHIKDDLGAYLQSMYNIIMPLPVTAHHTACIKDTTFEGMFTISSLGVSVKFTKMM
jgi:hypothetical protein